nr:DAK2 domain-containing protein [Lachnospiraceae bacterium]
TISQVEDETIENVCKAIQQGSLRGARGNSGVIMSQILRGFTNYIKDEKELDAKKICLGIDKAREQAYKAVIKPKEGTILTVIKALAEKAVEVASANVDISKLGDIVKAGDEALANTPNLLPILKEAGVVDSGGEGLMCFMHGVLAYINGEKIDFDIKKSGNAINTNINISVEQDQDIKYGYCTECMINNSKGFPSDAEEKLKNYLGDPAFGDSLVLVADDTLIKIHVHTNHPGKVFEKGLEYGYLTNLKVDNLKLEHQEKLIKDASKKAKEQGGVVVEKKVSAPPKEYGFISVSSGDGLTSIMKDLNIDLVIEGGQTMNPSTDDFIKAIEKVNAKNIFIFPNNGNIIMAAKQAKDL